MKRKRAKITSKYKGVFWSPLKLSWCSRIYVNKQHIYCGEHPTERAAALAYDKVAVKYNRSTNILKPKIK